MKTKLLLITLLAVLWPAPLLRGAVEEAIPIAESTIAGPADPAPKKNGKAEAPAANTVAPTLFSEKEVAVGEGDEALPGLLTMPGGKGPFPALVLVHDVDLRDRNHTVGKLKPFRDLAWGLASRGIAVLRYDKRTWENAGKSAPEGKGFTVKEEMIDDALAGVSLLRKTPGIDPERVFLLGHGLSGMLVGRFAKRDPDIAGFVVLSGMGRPLEDVIYDQLTYLYSMDGELTESDTHQLEAFKEEIGRVKSDGLSSDTPRAKLPLELPADYWLDLRGYDGPGAAARIAQPLLLVQGGRDYQVTDEDLTRWKKALSSKANAEIIIYPKLNHYMVSGERKAVPKEFRVPRVMDKKVVRDIARWIKKH